MRIVVDYTPAVFQSAGIGRHTRGLVHALAPIAAHHEVTLLVFGRPPAGAFPAPAGFHMRVIPVSNRWLTIGWHRLRLPVPVDWLSGASDLYHASDFVLPPVRTARSVLTVHDLSFLTTPQCADAGLRTFLGRAVPASVKRAGHILSDSENTRQDLIHLLGVPEDKVTVVYPGVEARFGRQEDAAELSRVRIQYGIGDGPFVLGLGTLEPRKNWPALIRAWARLRRENRIAHRLVIGGGKGWLSEGIFEAAETCGFRSEIVFTGFVADADLPTLYSAADVFVLPSLYEGFGIPVLEAMACGVPVVCSNNSSLPEAAGEAAVLVDTTDSAALAAAIACVVEDAGLRTQLQSRGLRQVQRFTWDAAARSLLTAYERAYHA